MTDNDRLAHCNRMVSKWGKVADKYFRKHAIASVITGKHAEHLFQIDAKQQHWQDKGLSFIRKQIIWSGWVV